MPVLPKATNEVDQRIDLLFRKFLAVFRHLALAVHDGIEDPFVAHSGLPFRIDKIARMGFSAFSCFRLPVSAVT